MDILTVSEVVSERIILIKIGDESVALEIFALLLEKNTQYFCCFIRGERRGIIGPAVSPDPSGMNAEDVDLSIIFESVIKIHCCHVESSLCHAVIDHVRAVALLNASCF